MSLRFFHVLFIAVSSLMLLGVGVWAIEAWRADGAAGWLAMAALAFVGGAVLVVYGNRFLQKTRTLGIVSLLVAGTVATPTDALACTVCLGNTDSIMQSGMNMGILALLGVTGFMLACFASFFVYLIRRARTSETQDDLSVPNGQFQGSEFGVRTQEGSM